jgi:formylglycine-generating enzyme required for sulfatase activity
MVGGLQVIANVPGTKVFLDGQFKGELTPPQVLNLPDLPVGSVQVRVEAAGYQTRAMTYTIQPGTWTQAVFVLVKQGGAPLPPPPAGSARPAAPAGSAPPAGTQSNAGGPLMPVKREEDPSVMAGAVRNPQGLWEITVKVDAVSIELVQVPAGKFRMGSASGKEDEVPVHEVAFRKPFWMSKYPITQKQFQTVMGYNPSKFKAAGPQAPVESVSWNSCDAFASRLNAKQTEWTFRLPSEAEWEYACRAGSTSTRGADSLMATAWYQDNSGGTTHPVGQKQPNAWGLYDMLGNVAQWCADLQHKDYTGAPSDGSAWIADSYYYYGGTPIAMGSGNYKAVNMIRGGGWSSESMDVRSTIRERSLGDTTRKDLGFRLVCTPRQ